MISSSFIAFYVTLRLFSRKNDINSLNATYERKQMMLVYCGYAKNSANMAMHLQVLLQNILLLWQLIYHKHIVYIPELLRCYTISMVNFN